MQVRKGSVVAHPEVVDEVQVAAEVAGEEEEVDGRDRRCCRCGRGEQLRPSLDRVGVEANEGGGRGCVPTLR